MQDRLFSRGRDPGWKPAATASLAAIVVIAATALAQTQKPGDLGFTDIPMLPEMPWHVHDPARPHPPVVTPGAVPGAPPSDAIVLFDGKDLSQWVQPGRGADRGKLVDPQWPVCDGYWSPIWTMRLDSRTAAISGSPCSRV
jgi:hypothetical protein